MANTSPRENFDIFSWRHFSARSSFYIINWYGYLPKRFPWKTFERNCQSSFEIRHWMLNVAHVTNYGKWRPIVTTFGTLIENMSRTGLYDCHIFLDDFMSNINWGIGVLHVKRQILTYFLTSFLCSLKFVLFHLIGHTKKCLQTNIEKFLWLSFCGMTVPSKTNVPSLWPWPLTYEGQLFFSELSTTL